MGLLDVVVLAQAQARHLARPVVQVGQVLEHHQRVEQRATGTGLRLDLGQRGMFELAHGDAGLLGSLQIVRHRQRAARTQTQRQCVDEHAQHALGAVEARGPAGRGHAEDDIVAAAMARQHDAPRRLHHGIEGDAMRGGQRAQAGVESDRQHQVAAQRHRVAVRGRRRDAR
ncbi:hypothetical protein D3C72_1683270 [compost metagenome]